MGKDASTRYEFRDRIGKGSFGEVFRAFDTEKNQEVAIKIIDLEKSDGKPHSIQEIFKVYKLEFKILQFFLLCYI